MLNEYKPVTSLKDEEITYIINEIFTPKSISNIERDIDEHCISADIVTEWNDGETDYDATDTVYLYEPDMRPYLIDVDFSLDTDDILKWKQYCLAKGCYPLLINNPYL